MASHKEMKSLGDDVEAVCRLSTALLAMPDVEWTDWERLFLDGLSERRSDAPLSIRQREILVDLRDGVRVIATVDGFSIARLIRECWLARFDLGEDDCAFLERLKSEAPSKLRYRTARKLLAIAHQLDVIPRFAETA